LSTIHVITTYTAADATSEPATASGMVRVERADSSPSTAAPSNPENAPNALTTPRPSTLNAIPCV